MNGRQIHRGVVHGPAVLKHGQSGRHVAIFIPSLHGGGVERMMVILARGFAERGLKVDLVLANARGPYLADVPAAVRVVDLKASRVLASLPGLVRYLRHERPEAMLSAMNYVNVAALVARRLARVPTRLVVSERDTLSVSIAHNGTGWLKPLMGLTYPWAEGVVAVSRGVADDLASVIGLARDRIKVVYNPVVTPGLDAEAAQPIAHPWFAPGEPPVVLGVGRLTVQKDFATLIQAFARLRACRRARLLILGEGEARSQLEALAGELGVGPDVSLPGFAANPFAYMRHASMFVLSSRWEGLPGVLIQAMACGTPVIATRCPSGPEEILENGRWGRLVSVGNFAEMADAMAQVLEGNHLPDVRHRASDFSEEMGINNYMSALGFNMDQVSPE